MKSWVLRKMSHMYMHYFFKFLARVNPHITWYKHLKQGILKLLPIIEGFSGKKGIGYFTQKWTLSKPLQISHAVLFRCVKQCSVCFLPEVCFVFEILHNYAKNLYLLSCQHVTAKTVISLKIQQTINLLQHVTLKKRWFQAKTVKILISR